MGLTIDATIGVLESGISQPETVVNSIVRQNIPLLIRDNDLLDEKNMHKLDRLIQSFFHILDKCLRNDIAIINRRMLHSSLSDLAKSPNLHTTVRDGIEQCVLKLGSLHDSPFVLVDSGEFQSMEEAALRHTQTIANQKEEFDNLSKANTNLRYRLKDSESEIVKLKEEQQQNHDELQMSENAVQVLLVDTVTAQPAIRAKPAILAYLSAHNPNFSGPIIS
ncbi:hypothetical protein BLNAU_19260 [Blattamonas nauphoetae]|uniref:Uncharacterized protein n=1 Tax=Blattamonas nauphoetae TaxID=2049346 RepID=A0ABQ9X686_9EUKA|nr:hypothetical protein BLNAU_19260 [Blattamonas nauphoetae]